MGQSIRTQLPSSRVFSCDAATFVSAVLSTKDRKSIPEGELVVRDPHGRVQGKITGGKRQHIPGSSYGDLVELPQAPQLSMARAVEICGATQGRYALDVIEHGTSSYRVTVNGNSRNAKNSRSLIIHEVAQEGRERHYTFLFRIEDNDVALTWVDEKGNPIFKQEDSGW